MLNSEIGNRYLSVKIYSIKPMFDQQDNTLIEYSSEAHRL